MQKKVTDKRERKDKEANNKLVLRFGEYLRIVPMSEIKAYNNRVLINNKKLSEGKEPAAEIKFGDATPYVMVVKKDANETIKGRDNKDYNKNTKTIYFKESISGNSESIFFLESELLKENAESYAGYIFTISQLNRDIQKLTIVFPSNGTGEFTIETREEVKKNPVKQKH